MPTAKSQALSLGLHVAFITLLFLLASQSLRHATPAVPTGRLTPLLRLVLPRRPQQRAGGSNRTGMRARRGDPPPTARRTFIPPTAQPNPALPLPITVAFDTTTIEITGAAIGDPYSRYADGGLGKHGINGLGDRGCCQGLGESREGQPGASSAMSRNASRPELIYKVEPEFSEEARKAKYQGVVVLTIEVDTSGQVRNPRVIQHLGLGLDERAIDAVSKWRFRPGRQDGKAVPTEALVQVTFQLL